MYLVLLFDLVLDWHFLVSRVPFILWGLFYWYSRQAGDIAFLAAVVTVSSICRTVGLGVAVVAFFFIFCLGIKGVLGVFIM